jgi:lysophospholipase L1-like esterase
MQLKRYPEDIRWTGLLQIALGDMAWVIEEGMNGRTTAFDDEECDGRNGLIALPAILKANQPLDAAIIMLGTNDCKSAFHATSKEITAGLELCLKKLLDVVAPENILLISPLYLETAAFDFGFNDGLNCLELLSHWFASSKEKKPLNSAPAKPSTCFLQSAQVKYMPFVFPFLTA